MFIRFLRWLMYGVAVAFAVGGAAVGVAGVSAGLADNNQDDVWAALFLCACGLVIGITMFISLRKSARRGTVDANVITAVGIAQMHAAEDSGGEDYDVGE